MDKVDKVNNFSKSAFMSIFGNVFEKTDWIAEKTFGLKPFSNLNDLKKKIFEVYDRCSNDEYLKIFNSHPQLAIEKIMTKYSKKEQHESNLDNCTKEELEEFTRLNEDYKKKFNFPFIIAVAGLNKKQILDSFKYRIKKNINEEFDEAKIQVKKIGSIRLEQILNNNL